MNLLKRSNQLKCGCGRMVEDGSVFCSHCKVEIVRANAKILVAENLSFQKMTQKKRSSSSA